MVLTFESVNETLWCYHSNETFCSCDSEFYKMKFGFFCLVLTLATSVIKG